MDRVSFEIKDQSLILNSLRYMGHSMEALKMIKEIILDTEVSFYSDELDLVFNILTSYCGNKSALEDIKIVNDLLKIKMYSLIEEDFNLSRDKIYFQHFIERIKQNAEKIEIQDIINFQDNKDAFKAFVRGNLRALINSSDDYKFAYWDRVIWKLLTKEEAEVLYGDFIKECRVSIKKMSSSVDNETLKDMKKKYYKWDNDNCCKQCLNSIKRDRDRSINLRHYIKNDKIICTRDGKVIDLISGEIREAKKKDLILNTIGYKLKSKEEADEFMNDIFEVYEYTLDSSDRLNFLNDFIAHKILGNSMQKAIFNIGKTGTGKSFFKNIINDLFLSDAVNIPYTYFTTKHKGNSDASRDDILVSLNNKKIALASEPEKVEKISQARFKNILSNSVEKARETCGKLMDVNLYNLDLVIDTNDVPSFTEVTEAVNRRLIFVYWPKTVQKEKVNPNFYKTVVRPKIDYVFSYYVYRALELRGREIQVPSIIERDTLENTMLLDSFVKFASIYLEPANDKTYIELNKLYKEYNDFCEQEYLPSSIPENKINNEKAAKGYLTNKLSELKGFEHIRRGKLGSRKDSIIKGVCFKENVGNDFIQINSSNHDSNVPPMV